MFEVIQLPENASDFPEQIGTKQKFWYRDADGRFVLFKVGRPGTGENWAEKVCAEICDLLEIPHASYELAEWRGLKGVASPTFVPEGSRLVLGNELLVKLDQTYPRQTRYKVRQHTLNTVLWIMERPNLEMPIGYAGAPQITKPNQVFIGYLMLDALVANQDRHHENWALIASPGDSGTIVTLAPTFDHASSLGRNETDAVRERKLTTRDQNGNVVKYCERALSSFYQSPKSSKPLSTLEAFKEAATHDLQAADYWCERLSRVTVDAYREIFDKIPRSEITDMAKQFAIRMLEINSRRLLEA